MQRLVILLGCVLTTTFQTLSALAQAPRIKDGFGKLEYSLGYVAVLSTEKTEEHALKLFADLKQRYSDDLRHAIPAILKAGLDVNSSAGTHWHLVDAGAR